MSRWWVVEVGETLAREQREGEGAGGAADKGGESADGEKKQGAAGDNNAAQWRWADVPRPGSSPRPGGSVPWLTGQAAVGLAAGVADVGRQAWQAASGAAKGLGVLKMGS